ncbi:DUF3772 domain-containing protein [Pelagibacterium sp.]|uniref:DUF3772 domain-containing protein n=1 Tax=Pelagibacterium sp. TaxID=1967288 RepID=UPI003A8FFAC1
MLGLKVALPSHLFVCFIVALSLLAFPGFAQQTQSNALPMLTDAEQGAWSEVADRAAQLLDGGDATEANLADLRAELVEQRTAAFNFVQRGSAAVRSLQAQLDALGPPPAEGEDEAELIATQRASLVDALARANAPLLAAQQAYQRSEVLIQDIDGLLRTQQFDALFKRAPTAINPLSWAPAARELIDAFGGQVDAVLTDLESPERADEVSSDLTQALILAGLGLLIIFVVHPLAARSIGRLLLRTESVRRAGGLLFIGHLEHLLLPFVGGMLIVLGMTVMGLPASAPVFVALAIITPFVVGLAYWLGHAVFSPYYPPSQIISLEPKKAWLGARLSQALGWVVVTEMLVEAIEQDITLSQVTHSVLAAAIVFVGCGCLWALGQTIRSPARTDDESSQVSIGVGLARPLALLVQLAAVSAALAAAIGYIELARQAMMPMIMTLGIVAAIILLHRAILALPTLVLGRDPSPDGAKAALIPVVLGAALTIVSLPILALVWGARVTDISELWMIAIQGVELGGIRFSLTSTLLLIAIFAVGLFATHWLQVVVRTSVLPRTRADVGVRTAVVTFIGYIGVLFAAFIAAGVVGLDLSNLAIVAGALSVGIGFGLQAIVSNFLSGIILLLERPIKEGDWIEVSGFSGTVKKIAVRSTRIETFDRHDVIVPNSDIIAGVVKNMTLGSRIGRVTVPVGVAYGSDAEQVRDLLLEIGRRHPLTVHKPLPVVLFRGLGDSALEFELRCYIRDVMETITVKSDLLYEIYREFQAAGVSIPFPQRDVHLHVEEASMALKARPSDPSQIHEGSKR